MEVVMDREQESHEELTELGVASVETRGGDEGVGESISRRNPGIADD